MEVVERVTLETDGLTPEASGGLLKARSALAGPWAFAAVGLLGMFLSLGLLIAFGLLKGRRVMIAISGALLGLLALALLTTLSLAVEAFLWWHFIALLTGALVPCMSFGVEMAALSAVMSVMALAREARSRDPVSFQSSLILVVLMVVTGALFSAVSVVPVILIYSEEHGLLDPGTLCSLSPLAILPLLFIGLPFAALINSWRGGGSSSGSGYSSSTSSNLNSASSNSRSGSSLKSALSNSRSSSSSSGSSSWSGGGGSFGGGGASSSW